MGKVVREMVPAPAGESASSQPPRRKRGWGRLLFILLVLLGLGAFFLPGIAGWILSTPAALAWVSGQREGAIAVGQANLSWQGPVQLKDVVLNGADGQPLANVATVTSEVSFWDLLTQKPVSLKLHLDGIQLTARVPDPGSPSGRLNVSELTNALQTFPIPSPARSMKVEITNCTIDFHNVRNELVDRWSNISATYACTEDTKRAQSLLAEMPPSEEHGTGEVQLTANWSQGLTEHRPEQMSVGIHGDRLSLVAIRPWLEKYLGPNHGLLLCSGQIRGTFDRNQQTGWDLNAAGLLQDPGSHSRPLGQVASEEPTAAKATIEVQGSYSRPADELVIPRLHLAADNAAVELQGAVKDLSGQQNLDVKAEVSTPGGMLSDLLPPELARQIQIEDLRVSDIRIQGSLLPNADGSSQPFTYSLLASWKRALAYGLDSQNGQMRVSYKEGQLFAEPVNVPVNGGKLRQFPVIDFRTEPATLHFQTGTVLENIQLTEAICRDWLKYISPTLADATSVGGRLSLGVNAGQIPLGHMEQADLSGVVAIQEGSVRPGPLAVGILDQVSQLQIMLNRGGEDLTKKAFLTVTQEDIPFRVYQGRVYHESFGAYVGDLRLSTSGSVGLDHTLALQMNLHLPDKWMANGRPVLQILAGQPMPFKITGTFEEPRIDASAMADFGKQIGVKAGVGLIEKLIERRQQRNR